MQLRIVLGAFLHARASLRHHHVVLLLLLLLLLPPPPFRSC
jgi:hypothetical protein